MKKGRGRECVRVRENETEVKEDLGWERRRERKKGRKKGERKRRKRKRRRRKGLKERGRV